MPHVSHDEPFPAAVGSASSTTETLLQPWRIEAAILVAWGCGAALLLLPLVRGAWAIRRLRRMSSSATSGALTAAMAQVASELRMRPAHLHLGPPGTMPMVWGILRGHVLLPREATTWDAVRMRVVLLHELAHVRRRDPLASLIAQLTRAVYWFNPLVWLAVHCLRVERERACDDHVLRGGVKASEYAAHVLEIVTRLQPAPRAVSVALAMAGGPRIEHRLRTILDAGRNRRALSGWLVAVMLLIAGSIAFSLSVLRAADEKEPPRESKPDAGVVEPEHERAKDFLEAIRFRQNKDGTFPASALAILRAQVQSQLEKNQAWEDAAAAKAWLEKTSTEKNWKQSELVPLLDEAAAWSVPVVGWAELREEFAEMDTVKPGTTVSPKQIENLAFGPPATSGLRVAWVLDPTKKTYAVGEIVKCSVVFHNSGSAPVQFVTHLWHQEDKWIVRDAEGNEIETRGAWFSGITPHGRFRLAPGQIIKVDAHGVAIGDGDYEEQFSTAQIGKVIIAEPGDDLRVSWEVPTPGFESRDGQGNKKVPGPKDWTGTLRTGGVKFKVVAADPAAKPGIGVATEPGRYALTAGVKLQVTRITGNGRHTNEARIQWLEDGANNRSIAKQHLLKLPDGPSAFAIAWQRGSTTLWIAEDAFLRRVMFADRMKIKIDRWIRADSANAEGLSLPIRNELEKHFPLGAETGSHPDGETALPD